MATLESSYRPGPAMRMFLEQLDKSIRRGTFRAQPAALVDGPLPGSREFVESRVVRAGPQRRAKK